MSEQGKPTIHKLMLDFLAGVDAEPEEVFIVDAIRALIEKGPKVDEMVSNLLKACASLEDEVCQKRATDWGIVNDAMVAGERYLKSREAGVKVKEAADE